MQVPDSNCQQIPAVHCRSRRPWLCTCVHCSLLCACACALHGVLCVVACSPTLTTSIVLRSAVSLRRHRDCSGSPLAAPISCDSGRCARCVRGGSPRPAEWGTCELFSVASSSMRRTASSNGMSRVASHHSLRAGVGYVPPPMQQKRCKCSASAHNAFPCWCFSRPRIVVSACQAPDLSLRFQAKAASQCGTCYLPLQAVRTPCAW